MGASPSSKVFPLSRWLLLVAVEWFGGRWFVGEQPLDDWAMLGDQC
jgi:hypothetical protein